MADAQIFPHRTITVAVPERGARSWTNDDGDLKPLACALYGGAAVTVGQPETIHATGTPEAEIVAQVAADTIVNVLHWLAHCNGDTEAALESAQVHFQAENEGGDDDGS